MKSKIQNKSVTLMFPLYKDKKTVEKMILNSLKILKKVTKNYEIIAVDDGCPDRSGNIVKKNLRKKIKKIKVFFHKKILIRCSY